MGLQRASARGRKVPTENIRLTYSGIIQKSIGGFGVDPVLTYQRDTLPGSTGQLLKKRSESTAESFVHKRTPFNLLVYPTIWRLIRGNSAPPAPRASPLGHAAPCVISHGTLVSHMLEQHATKYLKTLKTIENMWV